jgi:CRP/FNR family transcriptional regulator
MNERHIATEMPERAADRCIWLETNEQNIESFTGIERGKRIFTTMPMNSADRVLCDCSHCEFHSMRMFCNLGKSAFSEFGTLGSLAEVESGTKIFDEETPVDCVFVLCHGRVKLSATSRQGKTLILRIASPGDVLGLGATLSGLNHEVTAEAIEPTQVKRIAREDFLDFVRKHGDASLNAAQVLSGEYRSAFFDVRRLALSDSSAGRLASILLEWGRAANSGQPEMRFKMALTHEDLASLIGTTRETVTRILSKFKRDKLIQVRGATVVIMDPQKLEMMGA